MSVFFWPQMVALALQWLLTGASIVTGRGVRALWAVTGMLILLYVADIWGDHEWYWDGESLLVAAILISPLIPLVIALGLRRLPSR